MTDTWLAITGMALATYLTRLGGIWLVARVTMTPRLERWLNHLPATILVAIVAPLVLAGDLPEPGVVAISGGNHGAAVALAATQLGAASRVYVPAQIAIEVKLERMRRFGAEVVVAQGSVDQAMAEYEAYAKTNGALAVHPYGSPETITGQGTVGLEFEDQAPDLDTVLVAVGGGGLIGGVASWYAGRVKIVAVETTGTNTLDRTLQS